MHLGGAICLHDSFTGITQTYQGSQGLVEGDSGALTRSPRRGVRHHRRSGAGKKLAGARYQPVQPAHHAGEVIVNGRDLTKLNDSQLREARRDIGMVFQHFNLLSSRTVFDNVVCRWSWRAWTKPPFANA